MTDDIIIIETLDGYGYGNGDCFGGFSNGFGYGYGDGGCFYGLDGFGNGYGDGFGYGYGDGWNGDGSGYLY